MSKNILIFSDGTGQAGGLIPDEKRSNIYKLYRATRSGSDSKINPKKQFAFYDPGLGSPSDASHIKFSLWRKAYNWLSQATGLGVTRNIIDCYAAILQVWEPGDKIYLFGFSRGAYTARTVGGVLAKCGVPTVEDGAPIKRDIHSARRIAQTAVKDVYQHGAGKSGEKFDQQRQELAQKFRLKYDSKNADPYFIGVWDTVAALGLTRKRLFLACILAAGFVWLCLSVLWSLGWTLGYDYMYLKWIGLAGGGILALGIVFYLSSYIRCAWGLSTPWWQTIHRRPWRLTFYDFKLGVGVKHAKQALAIDENRKDFKPIFWDHPNATHNRKSNDWFEQIWFPGVHSDIGGGYPESESRLSDQTLKWMVDKATQTTSPILLNRSYMNLFPSHSGMQHDERKASWVSFEPGYRNIDNNAELHASVIRRFKEKAVLHYDLQLSYRPGPLNSHVKVKKFYE